MKYTYSTSSSAGTEKVGEEFGGNLKSGDIVALYGELGAGKTTFIRGICRKFSVDSWVKSPSFVFIREYPGSVPIYHVDLFRIEIEDPIVILDDYLNNTGIILIEWADKIDKFLSPRTIKVILTIMDDNRRDIQIVDPRN